MQRVKRATAVAVLPADPVGGTPGYFAQPNPGGGIPATVPGNEWYNNVQEELCAVIAAAGIALDGSNRAQLLAALRSAGVFQAPAQFDDTTKAATTGFVQRALGNLASVTALNSVTTLTAAHAGRLISLFGTGGFVVTLPLGSTVAVGATILFFGALTSGNVAVVRQGADPISVASNTVSGMTIYPGSSITLVWNGAAWTAWGESQLPYSPLFGASLIANGYQKLPSGLIVQWGQQVAGTTAVAFSLPISFPNAGFLAVASHLASGTVAYGEASVSLTQITLRASAAASSINWIAIGW